MLNLNLIRDFKLIFILVLFSSSIFLTYHFTSKFKDGQYAIKEQKLKDEYIFKLKQQQEEYKLKIEELNRQALEQQRMLSDLNTKLEKKYADAKKKTDQAIAKYNNLLANGWRLYDFRTRELFKSADGLSTETEDKNSSTSFSSFRTSCSGELSREASEFLLNLAADADKVVEQLKITQEYAKDLRKICEAYENGKILQETEQ